MNIVGISYKNYTEKRRCFVCRRFWSMHRIRMMVKLLWVCNECDPDYKEFR